MIRNSLFPRVQVSRHRMGLDVQLTIPPWLKQLLFKAAGKCGREHSEWTGYFCQKRKNHRDLCGCV
jgi:hypothetical protein